MAQRAIMDRNLNATTLRVLMALGLHVRGQWKRDKAGNIIKDQAGNPLPDPLAGLSWPATSTVARETGIAPRKVRAALATLRGLRYIEKTYPAELARVRSGVYRIIFDGAPAAEVATPTADEIASHRPCRGPHHRASAPEHDTQHGAQAQPAALYRAARGDDAALSGATDAALSGATEHPRELPSKIELPSPEGGAIRRNHAAALPEGNRGVLGPRPDELLEQALMRRGYTAEAAFLSIIAAADATDPDHARSSALCAEVARAARIPWPSSAASAAA